MDQIKSLFPSEIPVGKPPSSAWLSTSFLFLNHCMPCQVDIDPSQFTISHGLVSSGHSCLRSNRKLCPSHGTMVRGGRKWRTSLHRAPCWPEKQSLEKPPRSLPSYFIHDPNLRAFLSFPFVSPTCLQETFQKWELSLFCDTILLLSPGWPQTHSSPFLVVGTQARTRPPYKASGSVLSESVLRKGQAQPMPTLSSVFGLGPPS